MKQHRVSGMALVCLALSTALFSCQKEDLVQGQQAPPSTTGTDYLSAIEAAGITDVGALALATTATTANTAFTLPYSRSINWNNRGKGTYGLTQATADFGPTAYWKTATSTQSQTYNYMLRTILLKNSLTTGSVLSKIDIPDAATYSISYDLMFANDFDFSLGGKLGFGLLIGEGNTGGDPGWDGNGGSLRLGWEKNAAGAIVLRPDVYYKDQPAKTGNNFGKQYPATGSLKKGTWYKVTMNVKSNSGSNTDGSVQLLVNGTTVLNQAIRWTTNDLKRLVNNVAFENFRGGSTTSYQSTTDGSLYFDNVVIKSSASATTTPTSPTVAPTPTPTPTPAPAPAPAPTPATGISTRLVNWDGRANGSYGLSQAIADFGNANYWQQNSSSQSQVYNGMLKTTLLANSLTSGGVLTRSNITPGSQYELNFDMQFGSNFDFSWGGKVGYGLFIGEGNTGGDAAWDGNGGSLRLMWSKKTSTSPVTLIPYVYYKDQPGTYGNDFGKKFPADGSSLQKGTWYHVKMFVKSNTGSNTDGRVQVVINGTTVLDQAIRWTTNDLKRLVNTLAFETFRGGAESYWQSSTNGDIYFDNVKLTQLAR